MKALFKTVFYIPLYNGLAGLAIILPGHNLGLAVIVLTLIVKLILSPLQRRVSHAQHRMKALEPKIKAIKDKHSKDNTEQARHIMALYKEYRVNPFSSIIVLIIQIPILFALYYVFRSGFDFDPNLLYSFVPSPVGLNHFFLGIDLTVGNYVLAFLTGLTQFFQVRFMMPASTASSSADPSDIKANLAKSMQTQMKYFLPIVVIFIAASLPAAISLYWITSNLFALAQEWWFRRRLPSLEPITPDQSC
ncbi:MAG: YidC/Oxa1 family membrane protein insertase [Patescibacteria group bacterium]|nr:YidC/Oxa1 family membrane protein insertase [Patescibacteria group bacterium]